MDRSEDALHPDRVEPRANGQVIAELTVGAGVTDLSDLIIRVERMQGAEVIERLA